MESVPKEFRYGLSADERAIFSKLLLTPWKKFCVPGGTILEKKMIEPHIYSIPQLWIEGEITTLILLGSKEVAATELFQKTV